MMQKPRAKCGRENVDAHSVVIARLDRATQYPETAVIESISRGVLDPPHARGTTLEERGLASFETALRASSG